MDIKKVRQELLLGKNIYELKLNVADYGRVSTDKDEQLNSIKNQVNYFRDFISNVKPWNHVASYIDEGISGTQVYKREKFLQMIEDARLGKLDLILTKEVSRFARNTIDSISYTELLLKYGVAVFFISDNINTIYPDSEFRLTLMASMAQDEVRKLSERVKFGIRRSIKDGKLGGSTLTGYIKKDGKLIINEESASIVRLLFNLYSTGEYSFKKISEKLASEGYYTKKGKIFSETTLKKMLQNPRYKGFYTANLTEVEDYKNHRKKVRPQNEWIIYKDLKGIVPPIVSEDLWNRANKIYYQKHKSYNKTALNKQICLENKNYTSKIICSDHQCSFIRTASGKRKNNPVWQCNQYLRHGIKSCETPIINENELNKIMFNILKPLFYNQEALIVDIVNDYKKIIEKNNINKKINQLTKELSEQIKYKEKIYNMILKGIISDAEFKKINHKINLKISNIKEEIICLKKQGKDTNYSKKIINNITHTTKEYLDLKQNIGIYINLFVKNITVKKINNSRKHLELEINYNFELENSIIEINLT